VDGNEEYRNKHAILVGRKQELQELSFCGNYVLGFRLKLYDS